MRILLAHPGAPYSVSDVFDGFAGALVRAGHEVSEYALGERIGWSKKLAMGIWRANGKAAGIPKPTDADAVFLASRDLPYVAARRQADATLIITGAYVHPDALILMQRAGMPVGAVFTESPYEDRQQSGILPYVAVAWTNERASVPYLRQSGTAVHYLPCSYDPTRHRPDAPTPEGTPAHDVVFVGSDFRERVDLLLAVDWEGMGIDLGLYGAWSKFSRRTRLGRYIRDGVIDNGRAAALYRRAKIGLNLYRRADGAECLNPRAVELAACGAFTVSDRRAEVAEIFADSVPTFAGPGELEQQLRRWLADDAGRQRLAARLPAAVVDRTFDAAAAQVADQLREVI